MCSIQLWLLQLNCVLYNTAKKGSEQGSSRDDQRWGMIWVWKMINWLGPPCLEETGKELWNCEYFAEREKGTIIPSQHQDWAVRGKWQVTVSEESRKDGSMVEHPQALGSEHLEHPKCHWTALWRKNPSWSIKNGNATCDPGYFEAKGGWESNLGESHGPHLLLAGDRLLSAMGLWSYLVGSLLRFHVHCWKNTSWQPAQL